MVQSDPAEGADERQTLAIRLAKVLTSTGIPAESCYLAGGFWGATFRLEGLPLDVTMLVAPSDSLAEDLFVVAEDESGASFPSVGLGRTSWSQIVPAIVRAVPQALRLRATELRRL